MRYWQLYENNNDRGDNNNNGDDLVYRYDWLILFGASAATAADGAGVAPPIVVDIETMQDRLIQFVIQKKKEGLSAKAIDNYINHLHKFYRVNGVKGIDWELVQSYKPEDVKKTQDREYHADEVIAIEEKLDDRGKVASGVMRGSGIRRGAEPFISVGDLIPIQTKNYGKTYKIWVYRGTRDMYATMCTPEVAAKINAYFEYRMRFGEGCKLYGKSDHKHEYYDGQDGEVIERWYKADEPHLDPASPLI